MGYVEAVNLAFTIIGLFTGLLVIHFAIFAIIGLFSKKKFPEAEEKCRIGVIISARNEERVIANLINSIRACDYPQDKVDIFVIAHNCTDATAEICRSLGAYVYEYNNPAERTLGYAYRYLYKQIERDYGTQSYDSFLVMNADNVVPGNYIRKMNDAFIACGKKNIITSFRNSSNFGQNYMSCLYGIFFSYACRFEMRGRTVCNCTTRVGGTGYMLPAEFVKDGVWEYVGITEDWEFTADKVAAGVKVYYCDEAEFFDEQPTTVPVMLRQRLRWSRGRMLVCFSHFGKLLNSIFYPAKYDTTGSNGGGKNNIFSKYDMAMQVFPFILLPVFNAVLQIILLAFCPLFGYDAGAVFAKYFIWLGISVACTYLVMVIGCVILFICERKRIKIGFFKGLAGVLLFPIFSYISVFLDAIALCKKNVDWKPIPHYGVQTNTK